jgi:hypothetical protein
LPSDLGSAAQLTVSWFFPPQYSDRFRFTVQYNENLSDRWLDAPGTVSDDGSGNFDFQVILDADGRRYWRVGYTLE